MFDIGWQELFIVAILALIVVGPKDLPRALRTVMGLVRKARMMARDFQDGIDEVVREADLDDMKKKIEGLGDDDLANTVKETLDPNGDIAEDLNMTEIQEDLDISAKKAAEVDTDDDEEEGGDAKEAAGPSRSVGEESKTPATDANKDA